ncbi:MAG: hypothetical protein H8D94_01845 [Candidatus Pelagibacter sp.]|nr:hypothetical protein [Candidatus Pelagibacter sp.]
MNNKKKYLRFCCRGEWYKVDDNGDMTQHGNNDFSGQWEFKGVSMHHWKNGIDFDFKDGWNNPSCLIGGLVWDYDHGTIRQWGGSYNGKLPRITSAYIG